MFLCGYVLLVGLMISLHSLTQLHTLTKLHCNISGDVDTRTLHMIGVSRSRSERSISTSGKISAPVRTGARKAPGARVSFPGRRTVDVSVTGRHSSSDRFIFLLGFFPTAGTSYFYTFSADASDSLSMEHSEPINIDTHNPNCSAVLPQGAVAYCGTTAGTLIRWNIR